jgi:hypothetical protein
MESRPKAACPFTHNAPPLAEPDQAQYIRHHLNEFLERMVSGTLPLHLPPASSEGSEAAEWNDLKLSIGLVTRLIARWSCSTMLLRYLLWRTGIGTSRPALTASMAALCAPRLSIATFSRRPPKPDARPGRLLQRAPKMEDYHATGEEIVSRDKLFQAIPNDCKQAHDFVVVNAGVKTLTQEKGHSEEWPKSLILMVGTGRFELPTPCTPCMYATRLRYAPTR